MVEKTILVTGGAGFIGSALLRNLLQETPHRVITVDKLTYAGNRATLAAFAEHSRHRFVQADINDATLLQELFDNFQPDAVMHLAAETHVDRSIDGPMTFMTTNVLGTTTLLSVALSYFRQLAPERQADFRFLHVSTDEVFGALGETGFFAEHSPYDPRSPYAASKAASDHIVRAWFHTYGLPVLVTNCSNNYGPYQYPEKLIPLVIRQAIAGKTIPVYARGENVRDWLHVDDHVRALLRVLEAGQVGETYAIGANNERRNLELVVMLCAFLSELRPGPDYQAQIRFVQDRPGHDWRYAIDARKIRSQLDWEPRIGFAEGLRNTVGWYLQHQDWVRSVLEEGAVSSA